MHLSGNNGCISNHGWLIKVFFASLVRASQLFIRTVRKKTHEYCLNLRNQVSQYLINFAEQPKPQSIEQHRYTSKEPRAGLAPAACCLQGSRSTGLSYRGTPPKTPRLHQHIKHYPNKSCYPFSYQKHKNEANLLLPAPLRNTNQLVKSIFGCGIPKRVRPKRQFWRHQLEC